jgi:chitinase
VQQSPLHRPRRGAWPGLRGKAATGATAAFATVLLAGGMTAAMLASTTAAQATPTNRAVASTAPLSVNWYESAPYYSTMDSSVDLGSVMSATGQKAFDMAFILANGSSCSPSWDGSDPVSSDTEVAGEINDVRSAGGDVIVSAGGYNGTKLGQVCSSASATAAAYQQVITTYGLHAFDFDLEEPEIENSTAIANELGAAQILQREDPGLFVSITIPSTTTGANYFGGLLLDEAKSLGFTPNDYTIMPFDGGFSGGSSQVTALQDFNAQLMSTFGWSSSQAYAHEGFSGMNGRTDTGEYFYQSDFQTVLNFAESNGMSRFTFWSVNRDRECNPVDNNGSTSSECSSVSQNPWDFTAYTVAFANNTSTTAPTPPPTTPPPTTRRPPAVPAPRPGCRTRPTSRATSSPTTATTGRPTSGTMTRLPAAPRAPGTATGPAETAGPAETRTGRPPARPPGAPGAPGATAGSRWPGEIYQAK